MAACVRSERAGGAGGRGPPGVGVVVAGEESRVVRQFHVSTEPEPWSASQRRAMDDAIRYRVVCIATGALGASAAGWILGPRPELFLAHDIAGEITVWAYHASRLAVGVWVAISVWPRPWLVRGPLCGALAMVPVAWISQALPERGLGLPLGDLAAGAVLGFAVAATARCVTGLDAARTPSTARRS